MVAAPGDLCQHLSPRVTATLGQMAGCNPNHGDALRGKPRLPGSDPGELRQSEPARLAAELHRLLF